MRFPMATNARFFLRSHPIHHRYWLYISHANNKSLNFGVFSSRSSAASISTSTSVIAENQKTQKTSPENEEETSPAPVSTAAPSSISHPFKRKQACSLLRIHTKKCKPYSVERLGSKISAACEKVSTCPCFSDFSIVSTVSIFWPSSAESQVHPSFISTFSRGFVGSGGGLRQVLRGQAIKPFSPFTRSLPRPRSGFQSPSKMLPSSTISPFLLSGRRSGLGYADGFKISLCRPKGFISTLCYFATHIADHRFVNATLPHMATNHLVDEVQKPQIHKATRKKSSQSPASPKRSIAFFRPSLPNQDNKTSTSIIHQTHNAACW